MTCTCVGCSYNSEGGNAIKGNSGIVLDDYHFLKEEYGFTDEELMDFDAIGFVSVMKLRTQDIDKDKIHKVAQNLKAKYPATAKTEIYMISTAEGECSIPEDAVIKKISFFESSGTQATTVVYDLEGKVFYVNDDVAHELTDDEIETFRNLPKTYSISSWDFHNNGSQEKTTGSYYWKLVFQDENGNYYVYDGKTQDYSTYPDNYKQLSRKLMNPVNSL